MGEAGPPGFDPDWAWRPPSASYEAVESPQPRRWLTLVLAVTGLVLALSPLAFAREIFDYYTREYQLSFGTPIGVPIEILFAESLGITGAGLLLAAVWRARRGQRLPERPFTAKHGKAVRWTLAGLLVAATLVVGLMLLVFPFEAAGPTLTNGRLNDFARATSLRLLGLTVLADLLLVGWVIVLPRTTGRAQSARRGWYPVDEQTVRYWDGQAWTEHTAEKRGSS
jgi:hypothetical protein